MGPPYVFTQDDQMNPVYCTQCRVHIPRVVSNQGRGLCPVCIANNVAISQAQAQQTAQAHQFQQAQIYNTATGLGSCPQCNSPNIIQLDLHRPSNGGGLVVGGLVLCVCSLCCFWPLAIVGVVMMIMGVVQRPSQPYGTSRVCRYCGHRWAA